MLSLGISKSTRSSAAWSVLFALTGACNQSAAPAQATESVGTAGSVATATMPAAQSGMPMAGMRATGSVPAAGSGVPAGGNKATGAAQQAPAAGSGVSNSAGASAAAAAGSGGMSAAAGSAAGSAAAAGAAAAAGGAAPGKVEVGHPVRFIASIHGSADKLVYVDTQDAKMNWELDVPDGIQDFQLIGGNKVLVGYKFSFGFLEVDLATHKMTANVRDFLTRDQAILTSVKRLANGHTIIMAQGLTGGSKDLEVWEVDNDKMVYNKRSFKGCCGNLRVVRMTSDDHFLVGSDQALVELDAMGKEVKRLMTGGSPTYMGLKTADGTYYATNGHGGQVVSFPMGGQKKVLGGKGSSSASKVTIYQPGQFQILQNGNIVTTNWTAEDGGRGQQLVEYDPEGNMVWSWDDAAVRPQGMETLLVLDNLDPSVLNDDRDGVLKPQH